MLPLPNSVLNAYVVVLQSHGIPVTHYPAYKKWLRYYLDFCSKYPASGNTSEQARLFQEKLCQRKQTEAQRDQAASAVSMFHEMQEGVPELDVDVAVRPEYRVSDTATYFEALGPERNHNTWKPDMK